MNKILCSLLCNIQADVLYKINFEDLDKEFAVKKIRRKLSNVSKSFFFLTVSFNSFRWKISCVYAILVYCVFILNDTYRAPKS